MPVRTVAASTPNYVLLDGNVRIGPAVVQLDAGLGCSVIYGFSDKRPYDKFCANSPLALTPYPLVKGFLQNQIATPGEHLKLVVIDAAGPDAPRLHAATSLSVLEALQSRVAQIAPSYQLTFEKELNAYRVAELDASVSAELSTTTA